jgi:hypothetical protein
MTEKALYGAFRSDVPTEKGEWGYIDLQSVSQSGKPAAMVFVHPDGGPATDRTVVRVDLPDAIAPGATADPDLAFHDQLPRVVARTGYFDRYHLVAQWFPKVGVLELPGERGATAPRWNCHEFHLFSEFYADFGSCRAELTAPRDYLVRATGVEQGAPREAGANLAHTFAQDDVHDFVWTAWNGYAEPLRGSYDGRGSPHVEVEVLAAPEHATSAQEALRGTIDALRFFSSTLGPYPYPHVTLVVPPYNAIESGGMEYETFFTTVGSTGMMGAATRFVTVHEFGHGYFMGLLASNEFSWTCSGSCSCSIRRGRPRAPEPPVKSVTACGNTSERTPGPRARCFWRPRLLRCHAKCPRAKRSRAAKPAGFLSSCLTSRGPSISCSISARSTSSTSSTSPSPSSPRSTSSTSR